MAEEVEDGGVLDLHDDRMNVQYEGDPEADHNAFTPVPDGVHTARVKFQDDKEVYGKKGQKGPFLIAPLEVVIQEDGATYNGQHIRDWQTSMVSDRSGTSGIGDLCRLAGMPHKPRLSLGDLAEHVNVVVRGEPLLKVKTQWEGSCEPCRKKYLEDNPESLAPAEANKKANDVAKKSSLTGMTNWPQNGNGSYKSEVRCPDCGEDIQARPRIKKYLALKEK